MYMAMKKSFGFHTVIGFSLDYATFVVLIPTFVGFIFGAMLHSIFEVTEETRYLVILLFMGCAALYIHICARIDKGR